MTIFLQTPLRSCFLCLYMNFISALLQFFEAMILQVLFPLRWRSFSFLYLAYGFNSFFRTSLNSMHTISLYFIFKINALCWLIKQRNNNLLDFCLYILGKHSPEGTNYCLFMIQDMLLGTIRFIKSWSIVSGEVNSQPWSVLPDCSWYDVWVWEWIRIKEAQLWLKNFYIGLNWHFIITLDRFYKYKNESIVGIGRDWNIFIS